MNHFFESLKQNKMNFWSISSLTERTLETQDSRSSHPAVVWLIEREKQKIVMKLVSNWVSIIRDTIEIWKEQTLMKSQTIEYAKR